MNSVNSLTIRSARLRSRPGLFDVVIRDGVIESVASPGETEPDAIEVNAEGNLVT